MLVVGLTGGIASGKSEAARHFARLGVTVIDADQVARELVEPGQPALAEIVADFGDDMLLPDGRLDRATLGKRVFADPSARRRLEATLHPRIRASLSQQLQELDTPYAILVAPLLLESHMTDLVNRILVIDAPHSLQRTRARKRDGHDDQRINQIMDAQFDRDRRLAAADDVICNDQDLEQLHRAVEAMHRKYLELAADS